MRALFAVGVLALAGAVCGCGAEEAGETLGSSQPAIVGGTVDSGDPAVVVLEAMGVTCCTGTLIDARHVLTAAHCVQGDLVSKVYKAGFGADVHDLSRKVRIVEQIQHPYYRSPGLAYDVAVLVLESAVTDVAPLQVLGTPLTTADVGRAVRHVGFGADREDPELGKGVKREVTYPITRVEPDFVWSGAPGQQTCTGDSGGPALVRGDDGVERIAAVVSDGPNCHDEGWDQRVDTDEVRGWIQSVLAEPVPPTGGGDCSSFRFGGLAPVGLVLLGKRRRREQPRE